MNELPLNPVLYNLLQRKFKGRVRVSNPNEAAIIEMLPDPRNGLKDRPRLQSKGESYNVCCPVCKEDRFRCSISHMFGQIDDEGNNFNFAINCYNENCFSNYTNVLNFIEDLTELQTSLSVCKIGKGKHVDKALIAGEWPGLVERIDRLPRDHQAVVYLRDERGFDVNNLGRFYNVHYCSESFRYTLAEDRIIIPLYSDKKFVGWQGRLPYDMKKYTLPKYYTCPGTPKSLALYNLSNAMQYETGVLMEGPTDVWRLGPMGCCVWGSSLSPTQKQKFVNAFAGHSAVLLFDPEEFEKERVKRTILELRAALNNNLAAVKLPEGTDPGSLERKFLRSFITDAAAKQGVKVSWNRRSV